MAAPHVLISGHHASIHQASEFLKDRPSNPHTNFAVNPEEVTLAYGQRAFPKLVEVLSLPEVSEETTVECLKLVLSLLSNQRPTLPQEAKAQAISSRVVQQTLPLLGSASSTACELGCQVLASLVHVFQGRLALLQSNGIAPLIATLHIAPCHGAKCLEALSNSIDGAAALLDCSVDAISALVQLLQQLPADQDAETAVAAMQCLSNVTRSRKGVEAALQAQLPLCVVTFVTEVQKQKAQPGDDQDRQHQLCSAAAACLSHMCQHTSARPAVQKAGGIIMLARLCDTAQQQPLEVVQYASAALASITVEAAAKLEAFKDAGPVLMELLKSSDAAIAGNAKLAICNTADHPEARLKLQKQMGDKAADYLKGLPDLPPDYRYHVPKQAMMYIPRA